MEGAEVENMAQWGIRTYVSFSDDLVDFIP
jgi:hypothetical protein